MTKENRLEVIRAICSNHQTFFSTHVEGVLEPSESDVADELARFSCRPDAAEPNEESLLFMDEVFEGGQ